MSGLFISLVNMSMSASLLVVIVSGIRMLFRHIPKSFICILWAIVAIKLIFPVSIESEYCLMPDINIDSKNFDYVQITNNEVNDAIGVADIYYIEGDNSHRIVSFASQIWVIGMILIWTYALLVYIKIYICIKESVTYKKNIKFCDRISSPFIFGVISPVIILPSTINKREMQYVIAHEQAHLKRFDHIWKLLGFAMLSIYWFNPFMWIAYISLCRDIEMACDEKVIKRMDIFHRKEYTSVLLDYSISNKLIIACPLAFGENCVKTRINSVLNYKRPKFWVIILAVFVCIGVSVSCLTSPKKNEIKEKVEVDNLITNEMNYTNNYYQYPDIQGMTGIEAENACRIEQTVLDNMSTFELSQAVIDYPLLELCILSSYKSGEEMLYDMCDAYVELLSREDAREVFLFRIKLLEGLLGNDIKVEFFKDIAVKKIK